VQLRWDLGRLALVLGSTGLVATPAVGERPALRRRMIFIPAAVVLMAGVWVAHGPLYAAAAVVGAIALIVIAETRAKHRRAGGEPGQVNSKS